MRYTKYNYKKGNNDIGKIILKIVLTIGGAWLCGLLIATAVWKFLPQNNNAISSDNNVTANDQQQAAQASSNNIEQNNSQAAVSNISYVSVQCGYFSSEENAKQMLSKISSNYGGFIYNENGMFRVLCGVYSEDKGNGVLTELQSQSIECAKTTYTLNVNDPGENQIAAICDGYLKILNTTFDDSVKSVNTKDFKDWINSLDDVEQNDYKDIVDGLKEYINKLPDEIAKEDVANEMSYIYGILMNFKSE